MNKGYTYIMSDIHGASKAFYSMLKKIEINLSRDYLYINGDIVDRGDNSLALFYEIRELQKKYGNHIIIIKGNHELFVEMYIEGTLSERKYSSTYFGGEDTIREIKALSDSDRLELATYVKNLPIYKMVNSPKRGETIISHTGINYDHIEKNADETINVINSIEVGVNDNLYDFLINDFIQREAPVNILRSLDKNLIIGHVPTMLIEDETTGIMSRLGGKIIITDCGSGFDGGRLGCLRLEDDRVFYV